MLYLSGKETSFFPILQGENGDLKNRPVKMDINHVSIPLGEKASADFPDSSIGEGMDITIQGANGHVKHNNDPNAAGPNGNGGGGGGGGDTASLISHDSTTDKGKLKLPKLAEEKQEYSSDMSIGRGMDISITGEKKNNRLTSSKQRGYIHYRNNQALFLTNLPLFSLPK